MPKLKNYKYKNHKKRKKRSLLKKISLFLFVIFIFFSTLTSYYLINIIKELPDPESVSSIKRVQSTKIYDRTGKVLLYDIHGEEKRTVITKDQMNQYIRDATLAAEDDDFYLHKGIDFKAILRALFIDVTTLQASQGGSTITQQLVKNLFLTPEKTITRKIKEAILAIKIEQKYTKDQILTFYLNQVPYGSNAYGIEAAAITFFNKHASDLTLAESALLASLPKAPTYYSPYGNHKDDLMKRKDYILKRMLKLGFISQDEYNQAINETLVFSRESRGIKAPHFIAYVREYLEKKYGYDYIQKAGLKVYTTINYNIQKTTEDIIQNSKDFINKFKASNAAAVIIDTKTGQILAMVGSLDYFDIQNEGNFNVTTAKRQPGSAFKPFVYADLLEKGFTKNTVLFDVETEFSTNPKESYKPKNYDGKFRGPVAVKYALAQSLNIPAVKALYITGIDDVLKLVNDMGISTINNKNKVGLSLVLGGAEVKPVEIANAFAIFANDGISNQLTSILKIEDANGNIIEEWQPKQKRVLSVNTARTITEILSDNSLRAPVFGVNNALKFDNLDVAAKTGTTQNFKDAWTVGYTTSFALAVWVGNNNSKPMRDNSPGSLVAGPIFNKIVNKIAEIYPTENFKKPKDVKRKKERLNGGYIDVKKVKIDKISGKLATDKTPKELIIEKEFRSVHNILHYIDKNDILGPEPKNPESDPQYKNWEEGVINWFQKNKTLPYFNETPPTEYDDIHTDENKPKISTSINTDENNITINVNIQSKFPIESVYLFKDGEQIASDFTKPYTFKVKKSFSTIKIKAYDIYKNFNEISIDRNSIY